MELVDPELPVSSSSTRILPADTDSTEDCHRNTQITGPEHMDGTFDTLSSQEGGGQPAATDAERGIWKVEALLAKWKQGRVT